MSTILLRKILANQKVMSEKLDALLAEGKDEGKGARNTTFGFMARNPARTSVPKQAVKGDK